MPTPFQRSHPVGNFSSVECYLSTRRRCFQLAIENVGDTYLYNMISAYIIFPMSYRSMQIRNGALWSWGALHVYEGRVIPAASAVSIELNPREPYTHHRRRGPIRVLLFIRHNDKKLNAHIYKDADLLGEGQCSILT